jgi:hypothetical protein
MFMAMIFLLNRFSRRATPAREAREEGDDERVREVYEEGADYWHDEEASRRGREPLDERLHVRDRVRGRAEAEAYVAARRHRCLVVAPHQRERDEYRVCDHHDDLHAEYDYHRKREPRYLPKLKAHQRDN